MKYTVKTNINFSINVTTILNIKNSSKHLALN